MTTHKTIRPVEHDQETPLPGSGMQSGEVYHSLEVQLQENLGRSPRSRADDRLGDPRCRLDLLAESENVSLLRIRLGLLLASTEHVIKAGRHA